MYKLINIVMELRVVPLTLQKWNLHNNDTHALLMLEVEHVDSRGHCLSKNLLKAFI